MPKLYRIEEPMSVRVLLLNAINIVLVGCGADVIKFFYEERRHLHGQAWQGTRIFVKERHGAASVASRPERRASRGLTHRKQGAMADALLSIR